MENKEEIEVELFCSSDEYEIKQICSILEENNIPFIRRDNGSGSYMNLYMGQSIQEKRIFVSKEDYKKTLEIIEPFLSNNANEKKIEAEKIEKIKDDDNEKNKYNSIKFLFGLLMLGIPVIMVLIVIMAVI